jgi:hypothetical protein
MKSLGIYLLLMIFPIITIAESNSIEATNYGTGASLSNSDVGNTFGFTGVMRTPLMKNMGVSLNAGLSEFSGINTFVDSSYKSIGLGIFIREFNLGLIQLNYGYRESESDLLSGALKNNSNSFSIFGAYYIQRFDLSLLRSTIHPDTGSKSNTSDIAVSYYVTDNLRTSISFGGIDIGDSNAIAINYQPSILNNSIGISIFYRESEAIDLYGLNFTYYFDTNVNLFIRARKY